MGRAEVSLSRVGLLFDGVFFDFFFLIVLFGAMAGLPREAFFNCFEAAVFDFVGLRFVFLLLDGMAAVYHRGLLAP